MTTKHTPGPWKARKLPLGNYQVCSESHPQTIVGQSKKDADLISAAPDLLEALQIWMNFFDTMPKGQFGKISCDIGLMNDGFIKSKRALAKVAGE